MTEGILKVFDRRIRANPACLVIYEHEVDKFVAALRGMVRYATATPDLETDIRSGFAKYRGLPVRVARPEPDTPMSAGMRRLVVDFMKAKEEPAK